MEISLLSTPPLQPPAMIINDDSHRYMLSAKKTGLDKRILWASLVCIKYVRMDNMRLFCLSCNADDSTWSKWWS